MAVEVHTDWGPDTHEETLLKMQLSDIQKRYQAEAKPIIDRLIGIRNYKTPKIFVTGIDDDIANNLPSIDK